MTMLFRGEQSERIRQRYGLSECVTRGSSAELYRASAGFLWRLSTDAGSHNLMVLGAGSGLAFPDVLRDYGDVGPSDESDWDRYWLAAFEECQPLESHCSDPHRLLSFIDAFEQFAEDRDRRVRGKLDDYQRFLGNHCNLLREMQLEDSLLFVLSFADKHDADLDVNRSNVMVTKAGRVVITDLVHGADPSEFANA